MVARMMLDIPMHAGLKRDNLEDLRVNERKMLTKMLRKQDGSL